MVNRYHAPSFFRYLSWSQHGAWSVALRNPTNKWEEFQKRSRFTDFTDVKHDKDSSTNRMKNIFKKARRKIATGLKCLCQKNEVCQFWFWCVTLDEKSGGRVLDPVSLLTRKVFQLLNRCRMAKKTQTWQLMRPVVHYDQISFFYCVLIISKAADAGWTNQVLCGWRLEKLLSEVGQSEQTGL